MVNFVGISIVRYASRKVRGNKIKRRKRRRVIIVRSETPEQREITPKESKLLAYSPFDFVATIALLRSLAVTPEVGLE